MYDHDYPRYLHSFPTRRSSDLYLLKPKSGGVAFTLSAMNEQLHSYLDVTLVYASKQPPTFWDLLSGRVGRSEEHTSELQSRPHLVCRLLLEKKKYRTTGSLCTT